MVQDFFLNPFGAKIVLNRRVQGSGASSFTFGPGARTGLSVGASVESDIFRAGLAYDY